MACSITSFGTTETGREAHLFTLENEAGMSVTLTDMGACVVSVRVPDAHGGRPDVCLGYDGLADYEHNGACFGALVGRNANRIAGASFELGGTTCRLAAVEKGNSLHSGPHMYFERLWTASRTTDDSVTFNLVSRRGDQGFPGAVDVNVTYTLTADNQLRVSYEATPDDKTIINLTCHAYWNLNGHASGSVLDHTFQLEADAYTPTRDDLIPTGEVAPVEGTPYDFRAPKRLGDDIAEVPGGYDTNFVLKNGERLERACTLVGNRTGIALDVLTDSPGLQVYTAGGLDCLGRDGVHYGNFDGVALETQFFPDAIHHKNFPQPVYDKGHAFKFATVFAFRVEA